MTAVEFLWNRLYEIRIDLITKSISNDEASNQRKQAFKQAKEMENQQKIAYKISTPLGHVAHCIEKYGIEIAISEYKCKLVNNKESKFWNDCIKIAEYYNETYNN
jgi:hypothetical protein